MRQTTLPAPKTAADLISYPPIESRHAVSKLRYRIQLWTARYVGRRRLRELDDRLLMDIGISRSDAIIESRKSFWVE